MIRTIALGLSILGLAILVDPVIAAPPVEAFANRPAMEHVSLSPDGRHIAALQPTGGRPIVVIYSIADRSVAPQYLGMPEKYGEDLLITGVSWVNNNRIIVHLRFPDVRHGTPVVETRLIGADIDGSNVQVLPKLRKQEEIPQQQDRIYNFLPKDPDHVLLAMDRWSDNEGLIAYKMNVNSGHLDKISSAHGDGYNEGVTGYMADRSGQTRLRYLFGDGRTYVEHRSSDTDRWSKFMVSGVDESLSISPDEFSEDPNILYVSSRQETGRSAIYEYSISEKSIGRQLFARDDVDIEGIRLSRRNGRVIGYYFTSDGYKSKYTDLKFSGLLKAIDQALPKTANYFASSDASETKHVIYSSSPTHPGTYFLLDEQGGGLSKIADQYPGLRPEQLASVEAISYKARDGLTIPAVVTTPHGKGPFPMVVYPHGGPHGRDSVRFHSEAQFLASRGYLVLQPNFRGSTGYGDEFEDLGLHEWGLAMQDDITDGTKAMISMGMADPNRICIMGGSYGGYAALMGAVKTPDLFKCAIAFAPVTSVNKMLNESRQYRFWEGNLPSKDSSWSDGEIRRDVSPVNNVDAIKIPILLVHGEKDRRVDVSHSKLMAKRLKNAGKVHKLVLLPNGNHHRSREADSLRYLQEVEAFLAQHIGR